MFDLIQTSSIIDKHHPTRWPNLPNMLRQTMLEGDVGLVWTGLKLGLGIRLNSDEWLLTFV